jgi:hypothetical protein
VPQSFSQLWASPQWRQRFLKYAATQGPDAAFFVAIDDYGKKPSWEKYEVAKTYFGNVQLNLDKPIMDEITKRVEKVTNFHTQPAKPPPDLFLRARDLVLDMMDDLFRKFIVLVKSGNA